MKKITTEEIRDLFNRVMIEEISFSEMVEVINERVRDDGVSEFKDGDFLHSDWDDENVTLICKKQKGNKIYYHVYKSESFGVTFDKTYWSNDGDFRYATEAEEQELIDAIAREGKIWDAEKKCIEDII